MSKPSGSALTSPSSQETASAWRAKATAGNSTGFCHAIDAARLGSLQEQEKAPCGHIET